MLLLKYQYKALLLAINKKETSFTLSLDIPKEIKGESRTELLDNISEFLLTEVLSEVSVGKSPVSGQKNFKPLSKAYANSKKNGDKISNLELHGDMLNDLTADAVSRNKIKLSIKGAQAVKSYAHNTGYKGHPKLANKNLRRPFIPDMSKDEVFNKTITKGIDELIAEKLSEVKDG